MSAYDYLPKYVLDVFLSVGRQENSPDPIVVAKYFTPDSGFTWYATEFYPETGEFFGYVQGLEGEWGYFALSDLVNVRGHYGLRVERDLHFEPIPFSLLGLRP